MGVKGYIKAVTRRLGWTWPKRKRNDILRERGRERDQEIEVVYKRQRRGKRQRKAQAIDGSNDPLQKDIS